MMAETYCVFKSEPSVNVYENKDIISLGDIYMLFRLSQCNIR